MFVIAFPILSELSMFFVMSVLSIFASLLVAGWLSKLSYFSFLDSRDSRFESMDGLRGLIAISVLMHHFAVTYYWKKVVFGRALLMCIRKIMENLGCQYFL